MSKEKKSKSKSEKSSKSEKHSKHSGAKIADAMKEAFALIVKKPDHYTKKYLASQKKLGEKYGSEVVRGAIASLQEQEKIATKSHKPAKGKEKGFYTLIPLTRKAA